MKEENSSRLCIWAGNIAPFLNIYWVLLSARAAPASLSLGFLLKWPRLQQCLQADESTVCAHKRHSENTCQLGRGGNGLQPRLEALLLSSPPFLAQLSDPAWTVSWVWGNRLQGRGEGW